MTYADACNCTVPSDQHYHHPWNMPMTAPITARYAVVHVDCGHPAAVTDHRADATAVHQALAGVGLHRWRVRHLPTDGPEMEAAVTSLLETDPAGGTPCPTCRLDDPKTQAALAALAGGSR